MGFDTFLPTGPAHVKVLVLPVGPIRRSRFTSFVQRLEQENVIRLGDVSPDGRPNRTMFSPLAFPDGRVMYDISSSFPSLSEAELVPFELYRLPLLAIGIADGGQLLQEQKITNPEERDTKMMHKNIAVASEHLAKLREDYPPALVHRILIFDGADIPQALPEDIAIVPPLARSTTTTVKTVMCDMTSVLLAEMTLYAKSLQSQSTIDTPRASAAAFANGNASALPYHINGSSRPASIGSGSQASSPALDARQSYRISMPTHVPSGTLSRSSTPASRTATPPSGRRTPPQPLEDKNGRTSAVSPPRNIISDRARLGSQEQIATGGFGPGSLGERERIRGKARVSVLIGALYLLAGRWPDALKELSTGAVTARANSDYAWQAKAMDYLLVCLITCAWAGMDFRIPDVLRPIAERPSSSKSSKHSTSNSQHEFTLSTSADPENQLATIQSLASLIPDIVNSILNLYGRAFTFTDDKLPTASFCSTYIRSARLLTALNLSRGRLDEETLHHIVNSSDLLRASPKSIESIPIQGKSDIASLLMRAYPSPTVEPSQSASERLTVLCTISAVLSNLGYHRKRSVVLKDILSTLLPALVQARKEGAAEMGVHPAASLSSINAINLDESSTALSMKSYGTGERLQSFLRVVCQSFGIVFEQSDGQIRHLSPFESSQTYISYSASTALQQAIAKNYGPQDMKDDILRSSINICEALPDLEGALEYSTILLRTTGSGVAPGPESSNGSPDLVVEEQMRLANNISRTLSAAQHLGLKNPEADYWDEFLFRGIEVVESGSARKLVYHAKSELEIARNLEGKREKNPFIYNPFLKAKSIPDKPVLVAMEEVTFQLMMQNLYDFDILIDSIALETDGVQLASPPQAVRIGPYRTQTVYIIAIPQGSGSLTVNGCRVKIRGCRERYFGIFTKPWALKADVKGRNLLLTWASKSAHASFTEGQTANPKPSQTRPEPVATSLNLDVVKSQPLLVLKSISVPQSAVMLLEGGKTTLHITLFNTSLNSPADFFLVSFVDSLSTQMQDALVSKQLSASELYELESSAAENPSLSWKSSQDSQNLKVKPNNEVDLEVEIQGKSGLTYANIQVDYAFLGVPRSEVKGRFFSRQVTIPISITVNATLDLKSSDILALQNFNGNSSGPSTQNQYSTPPLNLFSEIGISYTSRSNCLLLLDFYNSFHSTLTLRLSWPLSSSEMTSKTLEQKIHPSNTTRIPIPISRVYLPTSQSHAPIPSLNPANKRQFIVSATKITPEAEREAREAFWYREEILRQLTATWMEESTGRTGLINLRRGLKLTPRMIAAYKLDELSIEMSVHAADTSNPSTPPVSLTRLVTQLRSSEYQVPTSTFLTLKTKLYNRSDVPIYPLLRLQPSLAHQPREMALDLSRKLLVNGVLQRALPPIAPGEERSAETGFVVLCRGIYEWRASVEETARTADGGGKNVAIEEGGGGVRKPGRPRASTGDMDLRVEELGRRRWVAERGCVVFARDT